MRKKYIVCLCVLLVIICFAVCLIIENADNNLDTVGSCNSDEGTYYNMIGVHKTSADTSENIDKVDYSYKIDILDVSTAQVEFSFKVYSGDYVYPGYASGQIPLEEFPLGSEIWFGPLDGTIEIQDKTFKIITSFAKLKDSTYVNIGITLGHVEYGVAPFSAFAFGENIFSDEI